MRGRWVLLALVAAAVWAAVSFLPTLASSGGQLAGLIGQQSAVSTRVQAVQRFGFPLLSHTAVVQRDPHGLAPQVLARAAQRALAVDLATATGQPSGDVLFAAPVPNAPGVFGDANGEITTLVTYLFVDPDLSARGQYEAARGYAASLDGRGRQLLGVSGTIPLRVEQTQLVQQNLIWVEIAAVLAVTVIVGVAFRSVVTPLIVLVTAGVGYVVAVRIVAAGADLLGRSVPTLVEPILVALLLGISTDYAIFFLSGVKRRLRAGQDKQAAVRASIVHNLPTVLTAGLVVAAGVLALLVARTELFRAFGPGLAATVVVGLLVSVLLVPALLAVLGRWAFWPSRPDRASGPDEAPTADNGVGSGRWTRLLTRRGAAAVVAVLVAGILVVAALPVPRMRESVLPMTSLPPGNPVLTAWQGAAAGFSPGILSPTEVIVTGDGIATRTEDLGRLQQRVAAQPGVSGVFGPGELPLPAPLTQRVDLFVAPGGDAVRLLVVFDADPLAAEAIGYLTALKQRMPQHLSAAGLDTATASYTGDTALALGLVHSARGDYLRVAVAIAVINLLLLMLFLRAVIAPLYLVACSFLALAASLGLTVLVFQHLLDQSGLIFFVPFAAGVLLVSLGADYLIFMVGDIWDAARTRELPDALAAAVPRSTGAISAAGLTLAASFAVVALVPVISFRELAFAMAAGVLIDSFVVRPLLVPALLSLVGRISGWPGRRLRTAIEPHHDAGR